MAKATIPLSTGLNLDYFEEEIVVMEKFDGVPIRVKIGEGGELVESTTRPGEQTVSSVQHLVEEAVAIFGGEGPCEVVFEVQHPTVKTFKDVSGMVRKDQPCEELYGVVWDCEDGQPFFLQRLRGIDILIDGYYPYKDKIPRLLRCPPYTIVEAGDKEAYEGEKQDIRYKSDTPSAYFEGWIARCTMDPFIPNKRQKGFQKDVIEPTVDLKIVGFEEATATKDRPEDGLKKGDGLGMVGRVIAEYRGARIGVGPGKLSHDERRELWSEWVHWQSTIASGYKTTEWSRIAEVKHKRDPSYAALRQPTFQHWRDDKTEPNEEISA